MYADVLTTTDFTKIIADTFYITFLPLEDDECDYYIDFLSKYQISNFPYFNRTKFIKDAYNKKFDEKQFKIFLHLLPQDLLDEGTEAFSKTLNEIEDEYSYLHNNGLKGGYIRAVLEVLYDSKFQKEFNELTNGFLKRVWNKKENLSFSIVKSFMDLALEQFNRKDYASYFWNTKKVTQRKVIGSTETGNIEKIDNPYSAYKVYAQGEYSKLRIGYEASTKADKKTEALKELLAYGFEVILSDEEICTYKSNKNENITIVIIPTSINKKKYSYEKLINTDKKALERIKDISNKEIELERDILILDEQYDAITKILQRFNNYKPYQLDEVREEIKNDCRNIYFNLFRETNHLDRLDHYSEGNRYSESEVSFINRYFTDLVSDKKVSDYDYETTEEKIEAIWKYYDFNLLLKNEVWQGIFMKSRLEKADKLDCLSPSQEFSPEYEENEYVQSISATDDLPKEVKKIQNLFGQAFPQAPLMQASMGKYFKKIIELQTVSAQRIDEIKSSLKHVFPEQKKDIDAHLENYAKDLDEGDCISWNELSERYCPEKKEEIIKAKIDFGFSCLDKGRSWDGTWNRYRKSENLGSKPAFRKKMYSIYEKVRGGELI